MGALYIYRMDDITPDMDWEKFWMFIDVFSKYKVKPLLGIVPDNKDPKLAKNPYNKDFWSIMRKLYEEDKVEFCQHGYNHVYVTNAEGILKSIYGFKRQSEFAGLSYDEQYRKIAAGKKILQAEGINTDVFMAPSHSFDETTLDVLVDLGFKTITDGVGLYPFKRKGLTFVPQQFWAPCKAYLGINTICLHTNELNADFLQKVENHLKAKNKVISFSDALKFRSTFIHLLINRVFCVYYILRRNLKIRTRIKSLFRR
jgi:predicted deacetylase